MLAASCYPHSVGDVFFGYDANGKSNGETWTAQIQLTGSWQLELLCTSSWELLQSRHNP